jgi:hypothetical protein
MKNDCVYVPDEPPSPYDTDGEKAYREHRQKTEEACAALEKMKKDVK